MSGMNPTRRAPFPRAPIPRLKRGTFYFAKKRNFLLCVDRPTGRGVASSLWGWRRCCLKLSRLGQLLAHASFVGVRDPENRRFVKVFPENLQTYG